MAAHSPLRKIAAIERDNALSILDGVLPEDSPGREALYAAQRDVVGSKDPEFQIHALVGVLARAFEVQQQQLTELREALEAKKTAKRSKAHVGAAQK